MPRIISVVALAALGLATISGCTISVDGDERGSVDRQLGNDHVGIGGMVNLTDPVAGDAFLAGGQVAIASEVQGDLVVAGGEVSIGGSVGDDLYAAGGNVRERGQGLHGYRHKKLFDYEARAGADQPPPSARYSSGKRMS